MQDHVALTYDRTLPEAALCDAGFTLRCDLPGLQVAYGWCPPERREGLLLVPGVRVVAPQKH